MTPHIKYDMPAAEYHAVEAVSATALKNFAISPAHEQFRRTTYKDPTAAMILGTAVHTATLEPDKLEGQFLVAGKCEGVLANGGKCTSNGKTLCGGRWYCGTHAKKFTPDALPMVMGEDEELFQGIISQDGLGTAQAMARSVRRHKDALKMLTSPTVRFEVSLFWTETVQVSGVAIEIPCKARLDIYDPEFIWGPHIADVKTCQSAYLPDFEDDIAARRYDLQAAWYLHGATAASLGLAHDYFSFLPVQSNAPHVAGCFRAHKEMLRYAHDQIFAGGGLLETLAYCQDLNFWPGYPAHEGILQCNLPQWHHRNEERERKRDNRL